ncbi:uncharacterized protein BHQ10_005415 [Talaromyces amestolkiae]|uniref:RRM domain-containing protein n=1 Tax=Talaromyces amestolkiae TaxID=1196081 RepID=A0A364L0S1_TALAM|nr:uncharacterized protein BHQ10_005415 [Talaromyces amestolkiae]RAO69403.1 hypothetical protein BHQ10_005415 [Talaromyces amestolkiae]
MAIEETGPQPHINLQRGWPSPRLLPAKALLAAAEGVLSFPSRATDALLYGPNIGDPALRKGVAEWLSRLYCLRSPPSTNPEASQPEPITSERICITNGASGNLAAILSAFTDPVYTRRIWMVEPTYFLACTIFDDAGFQGRLTGVPEDDDGVDVEFLRARISEVDQKADKPGATAEEVTFKNSPQYTKLYRHVIYLVPTFSNPSAKTYTSARREALVRLAREVDALIVTDDCYDFLSWTVQEQESKGVNGNSKSSSVPTPPPPRLVDVDNSLPGGDLKWGNATALHIRQAVVYDDQHGYPTGLGQIIVKNEEEAWRTYRKLSATGWDGHPLTVTLARASSPTRPIAGPTKSPPSSGHTVAYGGKFARHSVAGTPTPESPVTTEPIRSHSIASGTLYPQYIPPCTPTGHSDGTIQGFSPLVESPGGYGHHHHQHAPTGWNMQPDGLGMLTFSPPGMSMFPPPFEQQQIEYSYYVPYSHPMQIPVRGQPMYAETGYHEFQQQQQAPSVFFGQYPPTGNQYYQHQQHQGYHVYAGYESRKHSLHSSSTSDVYPNTAVTASYNNNGGMLPHQTLPQGIRHIIIDNICPGVDVQILQDHFRDAGKMLDCKIIRYNNHENGNEARYNELSYPGQCYATATFSTVEEAERAVGMYNGSDLGGSRVVVRLDTEWDPSNIVFVVVYDFVECAVGIVRVIVDGDVFGNLFRIRNLPTIKHSHDEQGLLPAPPAPR